MLGKLEQKQNYYKNLKNLIFNFPPLIFDKESSEIFRTY